VHECESFKISLHDKISFAACGVLKRIKIAVETSRFLHLQRKEVSNQITGANEAKTFYGTGKRLDIGPTLST
jgi:sRNA-binding carbon storage regulator CsrA